MLSLVHDKGECRLEGKKLSDWLCPSASDNYGDTLNPSAHSPSPPEVESVRCLANLRPSNTNEYVVNQHRPGCQDGEN